MKQKSIKFKERDINLQPFLVGTVVSLGSFQPPTTRKNEIIVPSPTGVWVITNFKTNQFLRNADYYILHRDLWLAPDVREQDIITSIYIEIEWIRYAYPHIYEPTWEIPNDYHKVFEVAGSLYQINQIMWSNNSKNGGINKFELSIHPLLRMADEPKVKDNSQSHRTIEQ